MTTAFRPRPFGTAGNYPAGSDDWSGEPRLVELTDGEAADGFTPDTPVPAEVLNSEFARASDALTLQLLSAMQTWDVVDLEIDSDGGEVIVDYLLAPPPSSLLTRPIVALGHDTNDSSQVVYKLSYGQGLFYRKSESPSRTPDWIDNNITGGANFQAAASGGVTEWLTGLNTGVMQFSDLGQTRDGLIASFTPTALHYLETSGVYLMSFPNGSMDRCVAPLVGISPFTNLPGIATSFQASGAIGTPGGEYASDGDQLVVFASKSVVGGVDVFRLFSSLNAGSTWAVAQAFGAGVTSLHVVWCEAAGTFVALASDGTVLQSATGAGWTTAASAINSGNGSTARHGTMACVGYCIAKAVAQTTGSGFNRIGIVYSFDLGVTWRLAAFADADSFGIEVGVNSLLGANGRFFATDGARVYRSGMIAFETTEY